MVAEARVASPAAWREAYADSSFRVVEAGELPGVHRRRLKPVPRTKSGIELQEPARVVVAQDEQLLLGPAVEPRAP